MEKFAHQLCLEEQVKVKEGCLARFPSLILNFERGS